MPAISIPVYVGMKQGTDLCPPLSALCVNNCVEIVARHNPFYWTETGSYDLPPKQSLDKYLSLADKASGIFVEFANTSHELAQKTSLVLPPDLLSAENKEWEKQNLHAADIADIIMLVATSSEINSDLYDFLFEHRGILDNKIIITLVVHDETSNFFHYPLNAKCADAANLEKANEDSAKGVYDTIQKPYTSSEMIEMLKAGMTKDTQNLLQGLEALIKKNFKKAKLHNAYFLPTGETPSRQKVIVEDQKIITDVKNWQLQRIYSEIAQLATSVGKGKLPAIAWEYLFRKCEDICFDTLAPICQQLEIDCVSDFARLKILNSLLSIQDKEIVVLLRDYSGQVEVERLKELFCNFRDKALGIIPRSKDHQNKCKEALLEFVRGMAYRRMHGRIKQQYGVEMPSVEQITEEALTVSADKEDAPRFAQHIMEKTSREQIIANWKKMSPLEIEKGTIIKEHNQRTGELRKDILGALEAWITIAELVDCKDKIAFIVQKREEILSFAPEKIFSQK